MVGAIEHYREFLIGRTRCRSARIWQEMYRSQYFEGGRVLQAAISAIDIALHDIKGKALGVPVYELLGGKQRDRHPDLRHDRRRRRERRVIEQAQELIGARLGRHPLLSRPARQSDGHLSSRASASPRPRKWLRQGARGAGRRRRPRHRLPPPAVSVAEAASFCQKMPRGTLDFLEEPIRDETPEAYEALRTHDRRSLRHRRGVLLASGSSCPTSSAASTSSTASTSAMSAASPRR